MKCFALKDENGNYIKNFPVNINHDYRQIQADNSWGYVTNDIDNAKQYRTESIAKSVCKRMFTDRFNYKNRAYDFDDEQACSSINRALAYINNLTVVEVDVDRPSFIKKKKPDVKFIPPIMKSRIGVKIKKGLGSAYCKGCGIYFSKIDHLMFGNYNKYSTRLCPWCIIEHVKDAESIIKNMDKSYVEEIEAERFINKI